MGIDLEPLSRDVAAILGEFAKGAELETIQNCVRQQPDEAWPTRLWCAKEAATKLLGTGLGGKLFDLQLQAIEPDGQLQLRHLPSSQTFAVRTVRDADSVIAYTSATGAAPAGTPAASGPAARAT